MIICKHLILLANFYSMWLILHVENEMILMIWKNADCFETHFALID
jgi:hypothetical protein